MTTADFSGNWTLVTGGGGGIGLAVASEIAQRGGDLVLLDRDEGKLNTARAQLSSLGVQVRTEAIDVAQSAQLQELAKRLTQDDVHIRHMVTAAGILQPLRDIEALEPDDHDRLWQVNYHGTYHCCRIWGAPMRRVGKGSIVTVSSVTAMRATPLLAYGPAKAALQALTASLSVMYALDGVRINAVAPGFTITEGLQAKFDAGQREPSRILSTVPMHRFVQTQEVAQAVAFLLSDQASAITGVALPVDCGWLAASVWEAYAPMQKRLTEDA